jgi:hypothetical protein
MGFACGGGPAPGDVLGLQYLPQLLVELSLVLLQ